MKLQIFDCDYILLNKKPIIRLFCKDEKGNTVCVFKENFLPYFYLHADEKYFPQIIEAINEKYPNLKVEIVEKTIVIGYNEKTKVLKITGEDPSRVPEIREFVTQFGTPYEADIPFHQRFMANNGLHGMQWIKVEGKPQRTSTVKCKAISCDKIEVLKDIKKNAPLRYMALDIECAPKEMRIPDAARDEIIMVGLSFHPEYKGKENIVLVAKRMKPYEDTISCQNEKEMLEKLKDIIEDYDPDIVGGHNINGFDLPFIIKRLEVLNAPRDFGRSEKKMYTRKLTYSSIPKMSGRVVIDTYEVLKRDPWVKFKRYDLGTVSKQMLGLDKIHLKGTTIQEIVGAWNGNGRIEEVIEYCKRDANLVLKILVEKHLMDKFFEISKACGLLLQDSLAGQSQRHGFRLLEAFHKRDYLMPCRPRHVDTSSSLKGAIVLEPEVGFHEWIICLDFTSMYPSLIRAFNICTTTFLKEDLDIEHRETPYGAKFVKQNIRKGVIPEVLKGYMERRAEARKQYRIETDVEQKRLLRAEQLALKDLANSLYGYTGYARSRLFIMDIANAITSLGRDAITRTKKLVEENFPAKVLYADTDSIFLKSDIKDLDEARDFGAKISEFISEKLYGLDLKFEKTYKTFLILAKKRYAGWSFEEDHGEWVGKIDMKGVETVRRDWCDLSTETLAYVIDVILKEKDIKKASRHVREIIKQLAENKVPLEKLAVRKGVSKALDKYNGIQPHVELAKKILKRDKTRTVVGQRLEYVIIRGNQMLSKRAEEPDYVREKGLKIDSQYYIQNQLLPPVERFFEACGLSSSELIEGVKQKTLLDVMNEKEKSPEDVILKSFDSIVCNKCNWNFRRPSLTGNCPKCSNKLYFSGDGFAAATVELR